MVYGEGVIGESMAKKWFAKEWVAPRVKPNLHPRKTMICIWWDWEDMVQREMLERNATVTKSSTKPSYNV